MSSNPSVTLVVPVFNEEENIDELVTQISQVRSLVEHLECVIVDDGSTDQTFARLQQQATVHKPWLHVVSTPSNCGQSAALVTGIRSANGELIVTMDGDLQNDPADIPGLLFAYKQHSSVIPILIAGNRVQRQDDWIRRVSSRIANRCRRLILRDTCEDTGCSLKVFPRQAFLALPAFDHMHRFLPSLFRAAGVSTINVPVNHRPRRFGTSKYGVRNRAFIGIGDLIGVRWLQARMLK